MSDAVPVSSVWADRSLRERIECVCALRHVLADRAEEVTALFQLPWRRSETETLAGEITPLADACKFIEQSAARLLAPKRLGGRGRPLWLWGVSAEIHREPLGRVLVIGPANYPLMLAGIQIAQALAAGNEVYFKPAPGTSRIAQWLVEQWHRLGVPPEVLQLLDEDPASVKPVLPTVAKVVMTGSEAAGRAVLAGCAAHLIPATMELSGCDAAFVLPGADLDLAANCLRFGLEFNSSASCIAPRRVMVAESHADRLVEKLSRSLSQVQPAPAPAKSLALLNDLGARAVADGAVLLSGELPCQSPMRPILFDRVTARMLLAQEDIFAPVASVMRMSDETEMLAANRQCRYGLGATVFGPADAARAFAARIDAGCVVINDMLVPSADPRLCFGGRGRSGFGVTRGAEGLLEMTRLKTVSIRRGGMMAHLWPANEKTHRALREQLTLRHGTGLGRRLRAALRLAAAGRSRP